MTLAYYGQPVKMCHISPPLRSLPVLVEKKTEKKKSQTTNNHVIFLFTLFIKLLKTHNRMSL
ncbi:BAF_collapsed_G0030090.mRNA.1.CDS.1 [Saccharomyces cerevisiae]|nr:CFA_G0044180.mRNA.1.CDS.1 [Saccharomyces cerevisiae]CAI5266169.1 BAF_HP2_G0029400.mRNA.1.CDS.1 [Saccharomyces cerevisiae]CAI6490352.1 BAF_HP2_G0029400.mRNA.1.CDS.1 [Saccharomyces cerevisiae]CAI6702315.1 BAF_HP1_G0044430.mRNA.1.CDS.1 [Saccharomyces cerevisiae]CAI7108238.1 BAF_collapsed_G0030090.mRNA.1.CDS.1 [Saccharomyces cerevisiae]